MAVGARRTRLWPETPSTSAPPDTPSASRSSEAAARKVEGLREQHGLERNQLLKIERRENGEHVGPEGLRGNLRRLAAVGSAAVSARGHARRMPAPPPTTASISAT